jgi:hypothetical protein
METKKTKLQIAAFKYILDSIDLSGYDINVTDKAEAIKQVYNIFKSEYFYNIKYYGNNEVKAFSEYLAGLPSCINIDFENYKIIELAKTWGSIPTDASENQENYILKNWFNFIANNYFKLLKRTENKTFHKINF